jgi:PBSX family phage terminase large subunit
VLKYPRKFLPKQKEVLDAVKTYKFLLYSGAFGAGKTLLISNVVIKECVNNPGSLWFVGSQTVPQMRDTVFRTFMEEAELYQMALDEAGIKLKLIKQFHKTAMIVRFFNGSEVLFRSCDEPSKFKSLNLDGFALDEPVDIDEDVFLMLQGRLRGTHTRHRVGILAGNPGGYSSWVYRKFFEDKNPEYKTVETTTYDNSFLPPDYITDCENSFDDDYANRGLVYKDFDRSIHVGNYRDKNFKYYLGGYDDGYRNPACLLTLGVDDDKKLYVVNEYFEKEKTTDIIVSEISEINKAFPMRKIFADPSAQNFIETAKDKRLHVLDANNDIDNGISKLKSFFKNDIVHIDFGCKNLIKELGSYRYEKDKFSKNPTERPIKKHDHACDALRYSVTNYNPFRKSIFCGSGKFR